MSLIKILALFTLFSCANYLYADVIFPIALSIYALTFWIHFFVSMIIEYLVLWCLFKKAINAARLIKLVGIMNICSVIIGFGIAILDDAFFLRLNNLITAGIAYMLFAFIGSVIINVLIEGPIAIWLIPEINKRKMIMYVAIANICSVGFYLITWGTLIFSHQGKSIFKMLFSLFR